MFQWTHTGSMFIAMFFLFRFKSWNSWCANAMKHSSLPTLPLVKAVLVVRKASVGIPVGEILSFNIFETIKVKMVFRQLIDWFQSSIGVKGVVLYIDYMDMHHIYIYILLGSVNIPLYTCGFHSQRTLLKPRLSGLDFSCQEAETLLKEAESLLRRGQQQMMIGLEMSCMLFAGVKC